MTNEKTTNSAASALSAGLGAWLPIETAPENQVEVLVFVPGHAPPVFAAQKICGEWCYSAATRYAPKDDFYGDAPVYPTFWQPLPEAHNVKWTA